MEEYVWISKLAYHPVFVSHAHPVLQRLAKQYHVNITIAGPRDTDLETYLRAIREAVDRRVAGIMIIGWGDEKAVAAVDTALEAGIPMVTLDSDIPHSRRLAHIGTDWFRMGWAMADRLAALVEEKGRVLIMGMVDLANMQAGFRGFQERMAAYPSIIVSGPVDDLDVGFERAREVTCEYLKKYPDLKGIAGFDGNSGPGAAMALESTGQVGAVKLVCVDADREHLDYIRSGVIDIAFGQRREAFTYLAFQMLYSYNHGSPSSGYHPGLINIPGNIDTGHIVVTGENLETFESELSLDEAFEQHELTKKFALISSMVENCAEMALAADLNGRVVYANPAAVNFFGFTQGQMMQATVDKLFEIDSDRYEQILKDISEGGSCWLETEAYSKIGVARPFHVTVSSMVSNSVLRGLVVIATDITERKQLEEQRQKLQEKLKRAEKMESLGILAGGVAHDLNNMLGPLVGYSDLILEQVDSECSLARMMTRIRKSARSAADVIQDLLTLARRGRYAMLPTDLNEVVRAYFDSPGFLKIKQENPKVGLTLKLDESVKSICGSFTHLQKVIMNLVINAFDAMPEGGELVIETTQEYVEELISGQYKLQPGNYVILKVSDTGSGIEPKELDKIFEPYYSKKKMGTSGSGLGLSVVYGIVKDHKGFYDVFSEVGKGTEFILYFPITHDIIKKTLEEKSALEDRLGGTETVLVVDDIEEQREMASEMLVSMGYKVETAKNGREAVQYLKFHSADLVLLDMIMEKDFDGLDTYREIIKIHPGQKVVVVSGFSQTDRVQAILDLGVGQYVKKPYSLAELAEALRRELSHDTVG
ncbi:MAG: substrate-binding domain-containing protein [candidate division Zixibacteria bacterium]|nr:substrate-binding domain-containing protein [candidate division Zixibacteria bacterium]